MSKQAMGSKKLDAFPFDRTIIRFDLDPLQLDIHL